MGAAIENIIGSQTPGEAGVKEDTDWAQTALVFKKVRIMEMTSEYPVGSPRVDPSRAWQGIRLAGKPPCLHLTWPGGMSEF